jgi:signal transduction histidine kinase
MELTLQVLAVLAVSALDLIVAGVVLSQAPRSPVNLSFALFAFSGVCWAFGTAFFLAVSDAFWLNFFARFLYVGGSLVTVSFVYFAVVFKRDAWPSWQKTLACFAPFALLFFLYFFTNYLVAGYRMTNGVRGFSYGNLHYLFDVTLWGYFFGALYIYGDIYQSANRTKGRQALIIMLGTYINVSLAAATNIIGPSLFGYFDFLWVGPFAMVVWISSVAYAISRYQLFNIRVIAAEFFIFSLWVFLVVRIFISNSVQDFWINGASFIVALILGFFLVRSVIRDVEQRERIEEMSNQKSEFMTFASHEIRNPITAMRGYASLITDGTVEHASPEVRAVAAKILVEGNDVLRIISEYLNKSKLELGQISYTKDPFDLSVAVSSIVDGYKPHAEQRDLTLEIHVDPSQKIVINADEGKVKEVIGNLIDNALKYTKHGGITVTVERHGVSVRTIIADTGVGIPAETLPQLFKKFSRADAQKVNLLGTGIGLYLAKTFIEAQGGRIWAESEGKDKGSRFIVEFPATS